jgi:hypothetical protein
MFYLFIFILFSRHPVSWHFVYINNWTAISVAGLFIAWRIDFIQVVYYLKRLDSKIIKISYCISLCPQSYMTG